MVFQVIITGLRLKFNLVELQKETMQVMEPKFNLLVIYQIYQLLARPMVVAESVKVRS